MKFVKSKNECLTIIPAKGKSSGIPRKNMTKLGNRPLIEFTIKAAIGADIPGRMCLSTEDKSIRDFGLQFPIEAPFLRPDNLSKDDVSVIPVIKHALDWYEDNQGYKPEFIILLQATNPFRKPETIKRAYQNIVSSDATCLISVNKIQHHPCEYIVPGENKFEFVMTRPDKTGRQNFPEVLFINGAIYITRLEYFREDSKLYDETATLFHIGLDEAFDIDEPKDLELANWIISKKLEGQK